MTGAPPTYGALLDAIRAIQVEGRVSTGRSRECRRAHLYWVMGDAIQSHLTAHQGRQRYGDQVMTRLASDLEMDRSLLYLILQFRQSLLKVDTYRQLTWSHFRLLLPCGARAEREFYCRAADDRGWSVRELKDAVAAGLYGRVRQHGSAVLDSGAAGPLPPLPPRRGRLYSYRLVAPGGMLGVPRDRPVVDLGFQQRWSGELAGLDGPRPGLIVTSRRVGSRYRFAAVGGFGRHTSQRFRLRGIDAAEMYSLAGRRTRDWLVDRLADAPTLVVATRSTDVYGRYLADVFYLPGETDPARVLGEGSYLNNELLRLDSVVRYDG